MFEFSCAPAKNSGFRTLMAERVSRQFEASKVKAECQLRKELSSSRVGSVPRTGQSRLFASSTVAVKSVLQGLPQTIKRAASATMFQRIAERLERVQRPSPSASVRTSERVRPSLPDGVALRQVPVASRLS